MNICVIPARGGSKRIPRKNIRMFSGKPMIAWSIEAAQASGCFDLIVVSTDDSEIADVATQCGADVPFMRPKELADDFSGTTPVVVHAIRWFQDQGQDPQAVCCLYATAPFVESSDIRQGFDILLDASNDQFVFTATSFTSPIQRALKIDPVSEVAQMVQPLLFNKRSQDLEPAFHDAGQFYWGRTQAWLQSSNLFEGSRLLLLPRSRVQDIDTEDDWNQAVLMKSVMDKVEKSFRNANNV